MKNKLSNILFILIIFIFGMQMTQASSLNGKITGSGVSFRNSPGIDGKVHEYLYKGNIVTLNNTEKQTGKGCDEGWYSINYNGKSGYVCSLYVSLEDEEETPSYMRPWTSPKKAIYGGAEFISEGYIQAGQNTSYLKRFNVNPSSKYPQNTHQYMANISAPFSEAKTSFKSYKENNLLTLPLHFIIPIFNNMPEKTPHPLYGEEKGGFDKVKDKTFESQLDKQQFPESYKKWLRAIHEKYPNWTFESLQTNLDFNTTVIAQQSVASMQKTTCEICIYKDKNHPNGINTEGNWYKITNETVAYYLDPRNFLEEDSILMFEDLAFNEVYKEETVKTVLKGTFMEGKDNVDNISYSSMFMEAGKHFNINPVYLASLSRQEMGTTKGIASSGERFEYQGITYEGFYNFFNIGAYSSAENPAKAGVVYASLGGERDNKGVYVGNVKGFNIGTPVSNTTSSNKPASNTNNNTSKEEPKPQIPEKNDTPATTKPKDDVISVATHLKNMNLNKKGNYLTNITIGITLKELINKTVANGISVKNADGKDLKDAEKITTGTKIKFATGEEYTMIVYGDITGDGEVDSSDLLRMRQQLLGKISLEDAYLEAAHVYTTTGKIDSADLLRLRQHLLGKNNINQA